jgi:FG-GAP-like repeat
MNFSMCIVATHTWIARAACLAFVGLTVAAQGQQFLIAPTYATQSSYQSDGGVNSVATADFNGDGKIDVAAVRYGGRTVSVLLGNGNGTFQESVDYACGDSATAVITADFNLDGKPDIAPSSFCQSGRRAASVGLTVGH